MSRKTAIWCRESVDEIAEWCDQSVEKSYYTLAYGGSVLVFYCEDDDEEVLFRLKWGHLFW